jgi:transposase
MTQTEQQEQDRNGQQGQVEVSPEVVPGPRRRIFSREYKLRILAEADDCEWGEIGALLRRERLHSSTLTKWRQQQAAGRLEEPGERKPRKEEALAREIAQLRREKAQLEIKLAQAEAIIAVQKKLSILLELGEE